MSCLEYHDWKVIDCSRMIFDAVMGKIKIKVIKINLGKERGFGLPVAVRYQGSQGRSSRRERTRAHKEIPLAGLHGYFSI